jgi:L-alanine-DL-glutamate epimerase-like enolase superfamily enzyme
LSGTRQARILDSQQPDKRLRLTVRLEQWQLKRPFHITGHIFTATPVIVVEISDGVHIGRGEAAGVYYRDDLPEHAAARLEAVRPRIEIGIDRHQVAALLPPGCARNALDCALWDLEAQASCNPVWEIAGLGAPRPLLTTFTLGAEAPEQMAAGASAYIRVEGARALKLKLKGDSLDAERVNAVRAACPDVILAVDANQGLTPPSLQALWPVLTGCGVTLVEQPYPVGQEAWLDTHDHPIPIAADETVQSLADIETLQGRFDIVNIKLDKCGGLTEALAMAKHARALGLGVMVGNMTGTSLAMAPAFVLGQLCDVVDLDGPVFLASDRTTGVRYRNGMVDIPISFWGGVTC